MATVRLKILRENGLPPADLLATHVGLLANTGRLSNPDWMRSHQYPRCFLNRHAEIRYEVEIYLFIPGKLNLL